MAKHQAKEKPLVQVHEENLLSRRDYFVGQALAGLLAAGNGHGRAILDAPKVASNMIAVLDAPTFAEIQDEEAP